MKRYMVSYLLLICAAVFAKEKEVKKSQPIVLFETNQGTFEITLMSEVAPKACENFLKLAEKGYYNGLIFHRIIKDFMIQGGDPTGTGTGGESFYGRCFEDEVSHEVRFEEKGLLAMANRGPNTNGSQFFITTASTPWLQNKHTIFGKVTKGYEIIDKIQNVKTGSQDRPVDPQTIDKIVIVAAPS